MTPNTRLSLIAGIIVVSAAYAVVVRKDPAIASAIAAGYVAILLTVLALVHFWRKPKP